MKNTPFKMKGFSGFVNSPLKTHEVGHSPDLSSGGFVRNERGGGPRPKAKKRRRRKGNLGYKVLKFLGLYGGAKQKQGKKISCGPGGCK